MPVKFQPMLYASFQKNYSSSLKCRPTNRWMCMGQFTQQPIVLKYWQLKIPLPQRQFINRFPKWCSTERCSLNTHCPQAHSPVVSPSIQMRSKDLIIHNRTAEVSHREPNVISFILFPSFLPLSINSQMK